MKTDSPSHTPGPWSCDSHGAVYSLKGTIAQVQSAYVGISPEEDRANARLVAAAPELLAALEAAACALSCLALNRSAHKGNILHPIIPVENITDAANEARTVIARATGKAGQ